MQHIVKLLWPLIPVHTTTKKCIDAVASRRVLPLTDTVKLSSFFHYTCPLLPRLCLCSVCLIDLNVSVVLAELILETHLLVSTSFT